MSKSWDKAMKSCQGNSASREVNVMRQKTHSEKQDSMNRELMADHEEVEGVRESLR